MKRKTFILLIILLSIFISKHLYLSLGPSNKEIEVLKVVDGDTITVLYENKEEKVRLIGIDTPESVHPDPKRNTPYGTIASQFTKDFIGDSKISLEFDVEKRDKYGRLLAYVYRGKKMLNYELVLKGHAKVYTFPPNIKYKDKFIKAQRIALSCKRGLWN